MTEFDARVTANRYAARIAGVMVGAALMIGWAICAEAAVVAYTDEAQFSSDLAVLGYSPIEESFEEDVAWGSLRSPFTAPSVTNLGLTWTANHAAGQVTTSTGPPRSGAWAFYASPHGSYTTGTDCHLPGNCGDGWIGESAGTLVAIGGWVTGFYGSKLTVYLDGDLANPVDFGETCTDPQQENCFDNAVLGNLHKFFGVIETNGFAQFEFRELEGTAEDAKYIWADDFTYAVIDAPTCGDGADNDGDGLRDFPADPGCMGATDVIEDPQCQDGIDNDYRSGTDFDGGESILGVGNGDPAGADPQCLDKPWKNRESKGSCGLGFELALLVPPLAALRRRRPAHAAEPRPGLADEEAARARCNPRATRNGPGFAGACPSARLRTHP